MARLARIIAPGLPHHVTQRGNRREPIFFEDGEQKVYRDLLAAQARRRNVEVWAYCLMPNHVHLIVCPATADGLVRAVGAAHRSSVRRPLHLRGDGRGPPAGGAALCGTQSGAGAVGDERRGLALVERRRALEGRG